MHAMEVPVTGPLWQPSAERVEAANMTRMIERVTADWGVDVADFRRLHRFSIDEMEKFWISFWDFAGIVAETRGETVLVDGEAMPGARFFPDARLNFAENLLRRRDDAPAILFRDEAGTRRTVTFRELRDEVARLAGALGDLGLAPGDRVAAWIPNIPESYAAMLGAVSLGGIYSSSSPDFGVQGVLDRFGQIEPKVLFAADGYHYGGRTHDCLERLAEIRRRLPSVERVVVVPYVDPEPDIAGIEGAVLWRDFLAGREAGEIPFRRLPFDHPLYILFSSGTTGVPKCIVHRAGGVLLQHLKEHRLHCDIKPGDRVFYFTTCGWMMWNWLATVLASEATLVVYDGSPFHPDGNVLFDLADETGMTLFGTSAKFIDAVAKAGLAPVESHDLSTVRTMTSTGSTLVPEGFDFVYERIKRDLHLASMSGGTDICACFVGGDPTGPVWRGEIQGPGLAMAVEVFDDDGRPLPPGEKGELVCTRPFPSLPLRFWNDPGDARYRAAYFSKYPNVWWHGDYIAETEHGGYVIYGRSDATLNPGGVRIGTAEIYRQVEQIDEVVESLVIGQEWDNDTRVVLFVRLREGLTLDDDLIDRIRRRIRAECTPRHVPARVVQVADIPRTKSGKIVELAVREVVHGRPVKNREALANPEALDLFRDLPELRE